ncbi:hypothetical protein Btru_021925 [Bulinus truncatus]|nr:hypothetical protein Btru_021925 [Bulinus truncatus]
MGVEMGVVMGVEMGVKMGVEMGVEMGAVMGVEMGVVMGAVMGVEMVSVVKPTTTHVCTSCTVDIEVKVFIRFSQLAATTWLHDNIQSSLLLRGNDVTCTIASDSHLCCREVMISLIPLFQTVISVVERQSSLLLRGNDVTCTIVSDSHLCFREAMMSLVPLFQTVISVVKVLQCPKCYGHGSCTMTIDICPRISGHWHLATSIWSLFRSLASSHKYLVTFQVTGI